MSLAAPVAGVLGSFEGFAAGSVGFFADFDASAPPGFFSSVVACFEVEGLGV
jgi:hypothetical protein